MQGYIEVDPILAFERCIKRVLRVLPYCELGFMVQGYDDEIINQFTCVNAIAAIQLAAILALAGTPAPRANAHVPTMNPNVVRPCNKLINIHLQLVQTLIYQNSVVKLHSGWIFKEVLYLGGVV